MLQIIVWLFWIGLILAVASFVFTIGMGFIFMVIGGIISVISGAFKWVLEKLGYKKEV